MTDSCVQIADTAPGPGTSEDVQAGPSPGLGNEDTDFEASPDFGGGPGVTYFLHET